MAYGSEQTERWKQEWDRPSPSTGRLASAEAGWLTSFYFLVCLVYLVEPAQPDEPECYDCIIQTGLIPPTEVPSPGSTEPPCRLRVMLVMVLQAAGAKIDQRDETSAEQDATEQDASCQQRH